ncbi:MAG TPA: NAD(P)H-dependent oxidoreductase [Bacillota bacterium]|nr:NAD(P)H-dependent oxidoreductase [Bacillota bacterium]HOL10965.1 NAD(P)H-dependent oxidoreductase [Bacillota bacterium]HPO97386.1 NAD(P)H-dependent oxidoreductase [Bacillota bacterium]
MKVSVILGHPYSKSFNHAIAETVVTTLQKNGHKVYFHDLYAEKFNPLVTASDFAGQSLEEVVQKHQAEIKEAEGIVIVHPNWWGQPPAILKGWVDRVLWNNVAYQFDEADNGGGVPKGLLKAKSALVFNTSNTPAEREETVFGDPLESIWKKCIFDFCGVKEVYRMMFRVIADSTDAERKQWLNEVAAIVSRYYPEESTD